MTRDFEKLLSSSQYDFIRTDPRIKDSIILLGVGGSIGYGMDNEQSDVDVRGIATNSREYILTGRDFEQVVNNVTDTTVYSFDKIIKLLCACNPNTIELLGLRPEHYLRLTEAGKLLLDNRHLFLSKRAIYSFGGYANAQLRRLENKSARLVGQAEREAHILKSIEHASVDFKSRYFHFDDDQIKLYIDNAVTPELEAEIFVDLHLRHYPLRDMHGLLSETGEITRSYNKLGKRNENAMTHEKLGKHSAHLVRLYLMCFDILEHGEIITYREKDHDLLMDIRNGKYLDDNRQPTAEFFELVEELDARLEYLKTHTELPDNVDSDKVMSLVAKINEAVVFENGGTHD